MLSPLFLLQSCVMEHQDCVIINYQERAQKQRKTKRNQRLQITLVSKGKGKKMKQFVKPPGYITFFMTSATVLLFVSVSSQSIGLFSLSADWVLEVGLFFFSFCRHHHRPTRYLASLLLLPTCLLTIRWHLTSGDSHLSAASRFLKPETWYHDMTPCLLGNGMLLCSHHRPGHDVSPLPPPWR